MATVSDTPTPDSVWTQAWAVSWADTGEIWGPLWVLSSSACDTEQHTVTWIRRLKTQAQGINVSPLTEGRMGLSRDNGGKEAGF